MRTSKEQLEEWLTDAYVRGLNGEPHGLELGDQCYNLRIREYNKGVKESEKEGTQVEESTLNKIAQRLLESDVLYLPHELDVEVSKLGIFEKRFGKVTVSLYSYKNIKTELERILNQFGWKLKYYRYMPKAGEINLVHAYQVAPN